MTETIIRKSIFLAADTARVWSFLTDPDRLATWFHRPNEALCEGANYEVRHAQTSDRLMWGHVRSARPQEYLEYTFTIAPMGEATSVVKWWLEAVPGGTRLSLEHSGLPQGEPAFGLMLALDEGWDDHLKRLRVNVPDVEPEIA